MRRNNPPRIEKIEWGYLEGLRPRSAGCNARLGEHGAVVRVPILRDKPHLKRIIRMTLHGRADFAA